ncbi:recombinase family protein [Paraburkholderia fungorum]|uniref:recombinase family protein n=1 Tax=Paraburkholderia fungorum TaxID=134537 RepID=UPI00402B8EB3
MISKTTAGHSKRVALYARVSTDAQTTENQLVELRAVAARAGWEVVAEYVDKGVSGSKGREGRPQFDRLLKAASRREFDMIASWSVDRLGRSLQHLVSFLGDIQAKGVGLYLHQQALDTSTPSGKALFQMCGVFAEFERAMIVERVKAGLQRAVKDGRTLGRPQVSQKVADRVLALREQGMGMLKIAKTLGCGVSTVQRILSEHLEVA